MMTKPMRFLGTLAMLAAILLAGNGCVVAVVGAAAAAGAGTYAYVEGELQATEGHSLEETFKASLAALKDLQFPVVAQSKDALGATITAREADNTKVIIKLKSLSDTATELRIRIGTFGDQDMSRITLVKIQSHLSN